MFITWGYKMRFIAIQNFQLLLLYLNWKEADCLCQYLVNISCYVCSWCLTQYLHFKGDKYKQTATISKNLSAQFTNSIITASPNWWSQSLPVWWLPPPLRRAAFIAQTANPLAKGMSHWPSCQCAWSIESIVTGASTATCANLLWNTHIFLSISVLYSSDSSKSVWNIIIKCWLLKAGEIVEKDFRQINVICCHRARLNSLLTFRVLNKVHITILLPPLDY